MHLIRPCKQANNLNDKRSKHDLSGLHLEYGFERNKGNYPIFSGT